MGKRLLSVLLLTLMMVAFSAVQAQEAGILTTTSADVRFRSGPGTDWFILGNLPPGTPIRVDARDGTNNFWIRGIVSGGEYGWVASSGVNITEDQLNSLPIKWADAPFNLPPPDGAAPAPQAQEAAAEAAAPAEQAPAAPPPPPVNVPNQAPVRGFALGGHVQDFGPDAIGAMQRAGMTWAKRQWRYSDGEGAGNAAGYIADAHAKGFRILLGVVGYPGQLNNPGYNERYAAFVAELAAAGADAIEIWNEPNIDREWPSGQIDPAAYTQLLAASYNAIKGRNAATLVISGAPAPTGFFGGCSGAGCDDIYFIRGMAAAGATRYMDCVGVHYNEGIVPPDNRSGDPRGSSGYYTRYFLPMVETYSGAFGGRVPLCFTELGYLTPEGFPPLPGGFAWAQDVTLAQQAAWLDRAAALARNSGRVRIMIIWNVDFRDYGEDPVGGFAIIRPDGSCPACDALGS